MSEEYTNIDIVSFEDDKGKEIEMTVLDEFDHNGEHYIALVPVTVPEDDDDEVYFCKVLTIEGEENFQPVEDAALIQFLGDLLEQRLINSIQTTNIVQ